MLELLHRPRAERDVQSIVLYLALECGSLRRAQEWRDAYESALDALRSFSQAGAAFPDGDDVILGIRSFLFDTYRIFYTYDEKAITVWRVLHTFREMDDYALLGIPEH